MAKLTETQKSVALALLTGPRTVEELAKSQKLSLGELQETLKEMVKLDLAIKEEGYPTKYSLKKEIVEELGRRQKIEEEDKNYIRIKAVIEMIAIEPEILKKATDKITESLQNDKSFTVYDLKIHPVLKQEEDYSTFVDLNVTAKDFRSIVKFMYFYGPSSVEIIKPAKIELSAQDFQDGLMDMAEMIQNYTQYIARMMNRQELESLHQRLINGK
jgi:hypothetical protein